MLEKLDIILHKLKVANLQKDEVLIEKLLEELNKLWESHNEETKKNARREGYEV